MITAVRGIYRDKNANEMNKMLKEIVSEMELEYEVRAEFFMDMCLNPNERREKTWEELFETPADLLQMMTLKSEKDILEKFISKLNNVLYSDYEHIPLSVEKEIEKEKEIHMSKGEMRVWLGTKVKPLILNGMTKQGDISKELSTPQSTLSYRARKGYDLGWKQYVEYVLQGIY